MQLWRAACIFKPTREGSQTLLDIGLDCCQACMSRVESLFPTRCDLRPQLGILYIIIHTEPGNLSWGSENLRRRGINCWWWKRLVYLCLRFESSYDTWWVFLSILSWLDSWSESCDNFYLMQANVNCNCFKFYDVQLAKPSNNYTLCRKELILNIPEVYIKIRFLSSLKSRFLMPNSLLKTLWVA